MKQWLAAIALLNVGGALAQGLEPELAALWNDPEFKKQFLGSYGIHPDVEPKVSADERALLEKIYAVMAQSPDQARTELETATTAQSSAMFDFILGNLHFQKEEIEPATKRYQLAVAKFPSYRRAHKNLGLIQMRTGNYADAIGSFTRMIELGGGDGLSYGLLANAYAAQKDFLAAEVAFRNALLLQPANDEWRLGLARTIFKQQKNEEAASLLSVLIERNPDKPEFWLLQAQAYLGMKQPLKAAENFEVVYRLGKSTPESMYTLGDIYVNEGQHDLAASAYHRAVELNKTQSPARAIRSAEALAARGATTQARELIKNLNQLLGPQLADEDRKKLLRVEARVAVAAGESGAAVKTLEELVATDPLDADANLLLGQHYARSGEPERAMIHYERAASIEGFEARAKLRMAQLLVAGGKYQEAVPLIKRSQELDPREEIARYLEQVERVARGKRG
jgi:tetratricopeptide (TPR) repeat protein